jgi:hypothetical protein
MNCASAAPWGIGENLFPARTPRTLARPLESLLPRGSETTSALPSGLAQRTFCQPIEALNRSSWKRGLPVLAEYSVIWT